MNSPPSSRLDSAIARLMTLRICLDWAAAETLGRPGPVMEFGLGNGRSYDHLRKRLPGRDIHVFDRHVAAHPDCVPPADRLWLGDFRATAPAAIFPIPRPTSNSPISWISSTRPPGGLPRDGATHAG